MLGWNPHAGLAGLRHGARVGAPPAGACPQQRRTNSSCAGAAGRTSPGPSWRGASSQPAACPAPRRPVGPAGPGAQPWPAAERRRRSTGHRPTRQGGQVAANRAARRRPAQRAVVAPAAVLGRRAARRQGSGACGLTALEAGGLTGFSSPEVHVWAPHGTARRDLVTESVVIGVTESRALTDQDVSRSRRPPRVRQEGHCRRSLHVAQRPCLPGDPRRRLASLLPRRRLRGVARDGGDQRRAASEATAEGDRRHPALPARDQRSPGRRRRQLHRPAQHRAGCAVDGRRAVLPRVGRGGHQGRVAPAGGCHRSFTWASSIAA